MSEKPDSLKLAPGSSRSEIADHINFAIESSDAVMICRAIGDATKLHNISDIAKKAGMNRPNVYRAFAGKHVPSFSTVLSVLDAMGLQLRVTMRRGSRAGLAKTRNSKDPR